MKVSVTKVEMEKYEIEYTLDEIRDLLTYRLEGMTLQVPSYTVISYVGASPETGGPKLIASFDMETDYEEIISPDPGSALYQDINAAADLHNEGLTQNEIDVWGIIRQAGEKGISYQRIADVMEDHALSAGTIGRITRKLVARGKVVQSGEENGSGNHLRKLWRSVE